MTTSDRVDAAAGPVSRPAPDDPAPQSREPLRALRGALAAAAEIAAAGDDAEALAAVVDLDSALEELPGLRQALITLLAVADPGDAVERHLEQRVASAQTTADRITALRGAVARAAKRESEFLATVAEHAELRERLVTLRRLERLATALGELEGQRQLIDDRLAALAAPVGTAESAVGRGAADLLRLTEERRSLLQPGIREALERAAAAQAELAAAEQAVEEHRADLAASTRRHDELVAVHREQLAALRLHAEADRAVAAALDATAGERPGLEVATAAVADVQARLQEIDDTLGRILSGRTAQAPRPIVT